MTTAGQLIDRALQGLLSGTVEKRNKLAEAIADTTDTTVVMSRDIAGFKEGVVFEIGSELFLIWEVNLAAKTLTVERGWLGTTKTTHLLGAVATLAPKFPRGQMLKALNNDLEDISSGSYGVFAVKTVDVASTGGLRQVDLTGATNAGKLLEVFFRYSTDNFIPLDSLTLVRGVPAADAPSTFALRTDAGFNTGTLRVSYSTEFIRATAESTDLQTGCLLPLTCEDIIEMGIIMRMMAGREIKRNYTEAQGDTRRAEEVPAGATRASTASIERQRLARIAAERDRLSVRYPITFR